MLNKYKFLIINLLLLGVYAGGQVVQASDFDDNNNTEVLMNSENNDMEDNELGSNTDEYCQTNTSNNEDDNTDNVHSKDTYVGSRLPTTQNIVFNSNSGTNNNSITRDYANISHFNALRTQDEIDGNDDNDTSNLIASYVTLGCLDLGMIVFTGLMYHISIPKAKKKEG